MPIDDKFDERLIKRLAEPNYSKKISVEIFAKPDEFKQALAYLKKQYKIKDPTTLPGRIYASLMPDEVHNLAKQEFIERIKDDTPLL